MVFGRIRRVHGTLKFIHGRTPDYIRLARQDVTAFRRELLEALLGLGVGAAAGMFFMCFLSVAIIVTAWDSRYRVLTTWPVCGGWGAVAANLLANAVRYADPGTAISMVAEYGPDGTTVYVENRGPQIEPHHLERLFDRFYRADPSRHRSSESSGLGLSIVRSIMLLHGGTWHAASNAGATRFTLVFPRQGERGRVRLSA